MSRYRLYEGGDPLAPPVDLAEALDAIGQDVMAGYTPEHAMREFLRRGGSDQAGLDELARKVAERRQEILQRQTAEIRRLCWPRERAPRRRIRRLDQVDRAALQARLDEGSPATR